MPERKNPEKLPRLFFGFHSLFQKFCSFQLTQISSELDAELPFYLLNVILSRSAGIWTEAKVNEQTGVDAKPLSAILEKIFSHDGTLLVELII